MYYHSYATFAANGVPLTLQLAAPSLYTMTYTLDGEGRPYTLKANSTTIVSNTSFNPSSQPTYTYIGTGTDQSDYVYDPNTGRMTNWTFQVGSPAQSETATVAWSPNGTLKQLVINDGFNSGGSQTCDYNSSLASGTGYDDLGRLIGVNCGSAWQQNFSYDQYDNLTKAGSSSWNPGYTSANNHYSSWATYDASGNLTGDPIHTYAWNSDNKLGSVDSSACASNGECVTYDAFGRIVETSYNGTYTEVWYTQLGKVYMTGGTTPYYAYWPTPGNGTAEVNGNAVTFYYMHKDWVGNSRISSVIVNPTVVSDQAYAPYGEVYNKLATGAGVPGQMFTGDTQDILGGVFDTPNRELNGSQGRWLSPDPAGAGWNQYAYVTNPNSFTDPSGLCSEITVGVGQGPDTPSGKALILIAQTYFGANVVFPYAGQSMVGSILDIVLQAFGLNHAATDVSSLAFQMTQFDAAQNGTQFLAVGFSGGAQANVSASGRTHLPASTFADPGLGLGSFLPKDSTNFLGSGVKSDLVNFTSPGGQANIDIAGCGHDMACIIANSPDLQKALADAGPCANPMVFTRTKNGVVVSGQGSGGGGGGGGGNGGLSGLPGGSGPPGGDSPMIPIEVVHSTVILK